jgi:hypothetical protein
MYQSRPTWELFEDLVRRILEARNFRPSVSKQRGEKGFDLLGEMDNERWAIEVKYYRTARAQPTLIEAAANRLVNNGIKAKVQRGMLVVSCILPVELREMLERKLGLTIIDQVDLQYWVATLPALAQELNALIEADPRDPLTYRPSSEDPQSRSKKLSESSTPPEAREGTILCDELKALKRGKAAWAEYEKLCAKILRYLFPNDLQGWHPQKRTDDGLNRFDFVCRVRPTTEFWNFLIDHLDSRYILFEFKNYSGKIKQGQILTTEKYLLERGLRRAAIILTRAGADPHAIAMTQGAMREQGKLMLIVNDEQVCKMLHMKERGDDPTDCLFELADDFLLSLPR